MRCSTHEKTHIDRIRLIFFRSVTTVTSASVVTTTNKVYKNNISQYFVITNKVDATMNDRLVNINIW